VATRLRLRSLTVTTARAERTYEFDNELTVITGAVAMGKSSLLMLVKYALGGNAVLTPAVARHVVHVTLDVVVGESYVLLRRNVTGDRTRVQVLERGSDVPLEFLSILSRKDERTVSQYLLGELGIPAIRVPKSRSRSKTEFVSVGFGDVFGYCYLQAKTIDSSATGHHDAGRDAKRITVFEILFNIVDPEVFALRDARTKLQNEINDKDRALRAVREFLQTSGFSDIDSLRAERWEVQDRLRLARKQLDALHTNVDALIRRDREQRAALTDALNRAAAAREVVAIARDTVRAREAALAQLRLDLAHRDKAALAANLLSPFEFVTCPRCLQSLAGREPHEGRCLLCLQPEPPPLLDDADDDQRARLTAQVAEMATMLGQERAALEAAELRSAEAELAASEAQRRYDELTRDAVSPRVQAVAEASAEVEGLQRRLEAIDQRIATWRTLGDSEQEIVQLRGRKRELDRDIKRLEEQLEARGERLNEISRLFAQEVELIGVSVNGAPTISWDDYLPRIGDSDLDALQASGGGSTTAINVAFSLALLNYAVQHPDVRLPNLLILDSPRKGIGRREREDRELGQRIYERLRNLAQALIGRAQLVIADNDAELSDERGVTLIELTRENSAVPGVENTGVGEAERVEQLPEVEPLT
jgi:hypothetical protein